MDLDDDELRSTRLLNGADKIEKGDLVKIIKKGNFIPNELVGTTGIVTKIESEEYKVNNYWLKLNQIEKM